MHHFGRTAPPVLRRFPRIKTHVLAAPSTLKTAFEGADDRATLAAELLCREAQLALGITARISNVARLSAPGAGTGRGVPQLSSAAAGLISARAPAVGKPDEALVAAEASDEDLFPESQMRVVRRRAAGKIAKVRRADVQEAAPEDGDPRRRGALRPAVRGAPG